MPLGKETEVVTTHFYKAQVDFLMKTEIWIYSCFLDASY